MMRDPAAAAARRQSLDHFRGCLLGGAVGDALGAPVEFLTLQQIRQKYGAAGIVDYDVAYGRRGAITDDTQMTLFTADGLLRGVAESTSSGLPLDATALHLAYLQWLHTQGERSQSVPSSFKVDGWLVDLEGLHRRRAPGLTCLSALRGPRMGTIDRPLNDSKGCGGVMRVAPVGLIADDEQTAFRLGCESSAITHGHPSGYYSAGCLSAIVHQLVAGRSLIDAVERALRLLMNDGNADHHECARAVQSAVARALDRETVASPESIETLGGGWVGEEALAIALYCALRADGDFSRGVLLAVNHSGDSDSTGAITGNLLGLMSGVSAIPFEWLRELELRAEIEIVARDLHAAAQPAADPES